MATGVGLEDVVRAMKSLAEEGRPEVSSTEITDALRGEFRHGSALFGSACLQSTGVPNWCGACHSLSAGGAGDPDGGRVGNCCESSSSTRMVGRESAFGKQAQGSLGRSGARDVPARIR